MYNLYLVTCHELLGWDTYSDFVVACETEEQARKTHPDGNADWFNETYFAYDWIERKDVDKLNVKLIGKAEPGIGKGVIVASFHAG